MGVLAMPAAVGRRLFAALNVRTALTTGAVSILSTVMVVAAVQSDGSEATNVQLDDGAVWVTNHERRSVARLNVRVDELDFEVDASPDGDVLQQGRTVVFSGPDTGVQMLDVLTGEASGRNEVPTEAYRLGPGIAAVTDRESGRLWIGPSDRLLATDFPDQPDALIEPGDHVVVSAATDHRWDREGSPRGRVLVVTDGAWYEIELDEDLRPVRAADEGEDADGTGSDTESTTTITTTTTIPLDDDEIEEPDPPALVDPVLNEVDVAVDQIAEVSSVGGEPVILLDDGTLVTAAGERVRIPGEAHRVQQPGPDWPVALVATDTGMFEVDLDEATASQVFAAEGAPAAPVNVNGCAYGAWSGATPTWLKWCDDEFAMDEPEIPGAEPGLELVFRVNQNNVALNAPENGDVFADKEGTLAHVGNWQDLDPEGEEDDTDTLGVSRTVVERTCIEGGAEPPVAGDDLLGVRPRQSIIDVLNNDDDINCEPIAVERVEPEQGPWGQLTIINDGQHLLYSPSDEMLESAGESIESFTFSYVVSDIAGNESSPASVTVTVKDAGLGNSPPELRPKSDDATREMRTVVEEGRSVSYDVLADWWDPDGDDLRLVEAVPESVGEVASTPDGLVRYSANGVPAGIHVVAVTMSDGFSETTEDLEVTVQPVGSDIPPVTSDDFITVTAGSTGVVHPLANDSDPNETTLELRPLWSSDDPGYRVELDGDAVVVTGLEGGTYGLDYEASDGTDATKGTIRLHVVEPDGVNQGPIAVPDQVKLRPNRVVNVDVLDNDIDPDGDLLALVEAEAVEGDPSRGTVRATIVERRLLQVEVVPGPEGEEPVGPFDVRYVIDDGYAAERAVDQTAEESIADSLRAVGSVTVLVQPPGDDQPPVLQNDRSIVRAGDVVAVPVLRNDVDPDSDELTLDSVDADQAAALESSGAGVAWVEGRRVFFRGGEPGTHSLLYTVDAAGTKASAEVSFEVRELPDPDSNPNQPPNPPDLVLRAVRNSTVRLDVPQYGVDPDGDSVELVGEFGRADGADPGNKIEVDPENPNVMLFTAGSRSGPRDEFTYTVRDRHGKTATGRVTVMVLDGRGWPPQANDDVFRGRPGRILSIPVTANDTSPQDRRLELAALPFFDSDGQPSELPEHPDLVKVLDQTDKDDRGRIEVEVPTDGSTLTEHYRISDGINSASAFIRVTPDPDAPNLPPVALPDEVANEELRDLDVDDPVMVDVLSNDYDPDDAESALALSVPDGQNAEIAGGSLAVPLRETAQLVLYRIEDAEGGTAVGRVRVPGKENHPPVLSDAGRNAQLRVVEAGSDTPLSIRLDEVVEDPDGDPDIALTPTEVRVLGGLGDVTRTDDGDGFVYVPPPDLTETTTISVQFEVTDRPERTDAERQLETCRCLATLTIDLIIEASSPPVVQGEGAVQVPQLDEPLQYDMGPLVVDNEGDPLTWTVDSSSFGGLDVQLEGSVLSIVSRRAGDDVIPVGTRIPIRFTASDGNFDPVDGTVVVTMIATNRGQPAAGSFETIEAERSVPISTPNFLGAASNPFPDRPLELLNPTASGGASVTCSAAGDCEFVSDTVGTFTITYTLRDAVGQTATGSMDVVVKGTPFAPGVPSVESVGDHVVNLTWTAADMQGGEFVTYHVTAVEAGVTKTFESTGGTFDELENATEYHFTVVAENELGMGEESAQSTGAIPDRVPDPPVENQFVDYGDQTLTLQWAPPPTADDFSTIQAYEVSIGGQTHQVDGGTTSLTVGLDGVGEPLANGNPYTFKVRAQNKATTDGGWGAWSGDSGTEIASRHPDPPTGVAAAHVGDGGTPRLRVTWSTPAFDGGRPVDSYQVCQVENPSNCQNIESGTEATFDLPRNTSSSFTVIAFNTDKNRNNSDPSAPSAPVTTVGNPDPPVISNLTSGDHTMTATASTTNGSGCGDYVIEYSRDGGATWQTSPTFNGLTNGSQYTVVARTRLGSGCGTSGVTYVSGLSNPDSTTPYGDLRAPSMNSSISGTTITWTWELWEAENNDSGRNWTPSLSGSCGSDAYAESYSKDFGYGPQTYTCTVTIDAPHVHPESASSSERTPAPPPPPSPTISLGRDGNYITGSGSNFPAGAEFHIRCYDGGGTFVDTSRNYPETYMSRYVDGSGNLSWGASICYSSTRTSVEVWTDSPSASATSSIN